MAESGYRVILIYISLIFIAVTVQFEIRLPACIHIRKKYIVQVKSFGHGDSLIGIYVHCTMKPQCIYAYRLFIMNDGN